MFSVSSRFYSSLLVRSRWYPLKRIAYLAQPCFGSKIDMSQELVHLLRSAGRLTVVEGLRVVEGLGVAEVPRVAESRRG